MRRASRKRFLCLISTLLLLSILEPLAPAQEPAREMSARSQSTRARIVALPSALPAVRADALESLVLPSLRPSLLRPPAGAGFAAHTAALLESAIRSRLGVPYRFFGTDDRGYDCSGFVWRVFQEAGANFERLPARALWQMLPEATDEETRQFGTLVFFNRLGHVGIVRDAYSFYHASRSRGIVLSFFAGYWEKRITGFRRAPLNLLAAPIPAPPVR